MLQQSSDKPRSRVDSGERIEYLEIERSTCAGEERKNGKRKHVGRFVSSSAEDSEFGDGERMSERGLSAPDIDACLYLSISATPLYTRLRLYHQLPEPL